MYIIKEIIKAFKELGKSILKPFKEIKKLNEENKNDYKKKENRTNDI